MQGSAESRRLSLKAPDPSARQLNSGVVSLRMTVRFDVVIFRTSLAMTERKE